MIGDPAPTHGVHQLHPPMTIHGVQQPLLLEPVQRQMLANQMIGAVLDPVPTTHHGLAIVVELAEVVERASRFVALQHLFPD